MSEHPVEEQWRRLARWWIDDGARDPVYVDTIHPLLRRLLPHAPFPKRPGRDAPVLDLGCGDGSVAAALDRGRVVGTDVTPELLGLAADVMPVVRARLPHLEWIRSGSLAGAYAVFVMEHLADVVALFESLARAVAVGGFLVVVSNHPAYTAPGAGPVVDMTDGEVMWRWGPYFSPASSDEPAGEATVTFHHRPLGMLLTAAAGAGWALDEFVEEPLSAATVARDAGFAGQDHLPRLFGARWIASEVASG